MKHHVSRIRHFEEKHLNTPQDLAELADYTDGGYDMEAIELLRQDAHATWQVLVYWTGYSIAEASWEPLTVLYEDAPDHTRALLRASADPHAPQALASLPPG